MSPALQAAVAATLNQDPSARQTVEGLLSVSAGLRRGPAHEGFCLAVLTSLQTGVGRPFVDRLLVETAQLTDEELEVTLFGKIDNSILYLHVHGRDPIYLGPDFQPISFDSEDLDPVMTLVFNVGAVTRNLRGLSDYLAKQEAGGAER